MSRELPRLETINAAERLLAARAVQWRPMLGGYSTNKRWLATLENGKTLFAKESVDEDTRRWLELERRMYESVTGNFMPKYLGWDGAAEYPVLFIEDLSTAEWPPPWTIQKIQRVKETVSEINNTTAPEFMGSLAAESERHSGWYAVAESPDGFAGLGIVSRDWIDRNLSSLAEAEHAAEWEGEQLLHLDIRSDNLCFAGPHVKVVDWNLARVGNGAYDLLFWLPSLNLEGGPAPWDLTVEEPELIAAIAGFFARQAPQPDPWEGSTVRQFQRQQLRIALPWACKALGIAEPDLSQLATQ
jgi:hypothetical protein